MKFSDLGKKPNVLIVITDQEREVMHWPDGWAEANLPARRRLMENGLRFTGRSATRRPARRAARPSSPVSTRRSTA